MFIILLVQILIGQAVATNATLATPGLTLVVTDPTDDENTPGTLRAAILLANANPGLDEVPPQYLSTKSSRICHHH